MKKKYILPLAGITIIYIVGFLAYSSVDNSLSGEDRRFIVKYLSGIKKLPVSPTFGDELDFITSVQRSVLNIAPGNTGLPFGQRREPKELYLARTGECYDKSRVIEKILRFSGFKTRHVAIYSTKETGSAIKSLFTPDISSHAVTEVLTKKGWLIVDSSELFVSINKNNQPVSIEDMHHAVKNSAAIQWNSNPQIKIYSQNFTFVYGLYSRHGQFYPPYNFIPDINYSEFIQNIL